VNQLEFAHADFCDSHRLEEQARSLLEKIGCAALAKFVRVRWNHRLTSTAGNANSAEGLISLNPKLAAAGSEEIDRTLRHELAHLVARANAGRRRIAPHGPEWKEACARLGLRGEKRCHDLPFPRRKLVTRHFYQCRNCATQINRVRPFRRSVACLSCCRKHSGGRFDERFKLVKLRPAK
jgi:SprT protein